MLFYLCDAWLTWCWDEGPFFSITVESEPRIIGDTGALKTRDVKEAVNWVQSHKSDLLRVWNLELTALDVDWRMVNERSATMSLEC